MVIKKFEAGTETEAILLAKEELGKEAIVMNIKTIKPRGFQKLFKKASVEVTAAIDEETNYNSGEKMLSKLQELKENEVQQIPKTSKEEFLKNNKDIIIEEEPEETTKEVEILGIEDRLNNLQELLEKQIKTKGNEEKEQVNGETKVEKSKTDACIELIYNQLLSNEVEDQYAKSIIDEIRSTLKKDSAVDNILASIYQKIILKLGQPSTISLQEGHPKYIFFIGPTGVGKTTTIAKIASDLKVQKKAKVALITSDTYRIAAVEQLRTYANILGAPLKVVYDEGEMKDIIEELQDYDIVLVDTAGRSHRSKEQRDDVEKLIESVPKEERDVFLVLSATTKYRDLVKITEAYSKITKYNLIFTKLDETCCIGNILNIRMLTDASLSYSTSGQNVPDDIEKIDAQNIAKQLLGGQ